MMPVDVELTSAFGPSLPVSDPEMPEIGTVWNAGHIEVVLSGSVNERRMRALWRRRQGNRAKPLLVVVPAGGSQVRLLGPQRSEDPIREIALDSLITTLSEL